MPVGLPGLGCQPWPLLAPGRHPVGSEWPSSASRATAKEGMMTGERKKGRRGGGVATDSGWHWADRRRGTHLAARGSRGGGGKRAVGQPSWTMAPAWFGPGGMPVGSSGLGRVPWLLLVLGRRPVESERPSPVSHAIAREGTVTKNRGEERRKKGKEKKGERKERRRGGVAASGGRHWASRQRTTHPTTRGSQGGGGKRAVGSIASGRHIRLYCSSAHGSIQP